MTPTAFSPQAAPANGFTKNVSVRFTEEQHAALKAKYGEKAELAPILRDLALKTLSGATAPPEIPESHRIAAFVIGALSPDIDPTAALLLLQEHLAQPQEEGEPQE